jgi:hypothetical protein
MGISGGWAGQDGEWARIRPFELLAPHPVVTRMGVDRVGEEEREAKGASQILVDCEKVVNSWRHNWFARFALYVRRSEVGMRASSSSSLLWLSPCFPPLDGKVVERQEGALLFRPGQSGAAGTGHLHKGRIVHVGHSILPSA